MIAFRTCGICRSFVYVTHVKGSYARTTHLSSVRTKPHVHILCTVGEGTLETGVRFRDGSRVCMLCVLCTFCMLCVVCVACRHERQSSCVCLRVDLEPRCTETTTHTPLIRMAKCQGNGKFIRHK